MCLSDKAHVHGPPGLMIVQRRVKDPRPAAKEWKNVEERGVNRGMPERSTGILYVYGLSHCAVSFMDAMQTQPEELNKSIKISL